MNVLASIFRDDPEIVNLALRTAAMEAVAVPFRTVWEIVPRSDQFEMVGRLAQTDPEFSDALSHARLGVITASAWEGALRKADPLPKGEADEWVTMTPSAGGQVGLTLPDDAHPKATWSMFDGRSPVSRPLVIEFESFAEATWRVSEIRHCGLPERAKCASGTCGTCRLRHRRGKQSGLVCICEHDGAS